MCSISLLVKYELRLRYEARVTALGVSRLTNAFQGHLPRNSLEISRFYTDDFSAKCAQKIPAKFALNRPFFREFVTENPAKFAFFPRPTRSLVLRSLSASSLVKILTTPGVWKEEK